MNPSRTSTLSSSRTEYANGPSENFWVKADVSGSIVSVKNNDLPFKNVDAVSNINKRKKLSFRDMSRFLALPILKSKQLNQKGLMMNSIV